jgi:stage II sporulation SpoAA-like protein
MRSTWIEYKGKKIFYQDFSKNFFNSAAVKTELDEVQKIVTAQPLNSVLVLSDFRDTNVGSDLLTAMNAASTATKAHVQKTAVLGVTGMKRKLADLLTALTGQPLKYFDDLESAKNWLAEDQV